MFLATDLVLGDTAREATEVDMVHRFVADDELRQMIADRRVVDGPSLAALTLFTLRVA